MVADRLLRPLLLVIVLGGCTAAPLVPWSADEIPMVRVPASQAGVVDRRGSFRRLYCTVYNERLRPGPDDAACDDWLLRVQGERPPAATAIGLGPSRTGLIAVIVPGFGWNCLEPWFYDHDPAAIRIRELGFGLELLEVEALSGPQANGRIIRERVRQLADQHPDRPIALVGLSKGAVDSLEALVEDADLRARVTALASIAGAIGGSPLAADAEPWQSRLLAWLPNNECDIGDGEALESLRPTVRNNWLADHLPLPTGMRYYSVVAMPEPDRISPLLRPVHSRLGRIDGRNDGQLLVQDQFIPGSDLLAFVNADHSTVTIPVTYQSTRLGEWLNDDSRYPRGVLLEALLRFIERDLVAGE